MSRSNYKSELPNTEKYTKMANKLEQEIKEYIESRINAVKKVMILNYENLLPAEIAQASLNEWIDDVDMSSLDWQQADTFFVLGADDKCWWIRKQFTVPETNSDWQLGINFHLGGFTGVGYGALLYLDGKEYESFTPPMGHMFSGHEIIILPDNLQAGQTLDLTLKCYTGRDHGPEHKAEPRLLRQFSAVKINKPATALYYKAMASLRLLESLQQDSGAYLCISQILKQSLKIIDFSDATLERTYSSIKSALDNLEQSLDDIKQTSIDLITFVGIGHAHIDTAWTWPYSVTKEKAVQTSATALGLIDKYPEYIFHQGQPQLYEFVKQNAPRLYERIKHAVKKGQWDADGGMWVEPDCNIPSGESLVRHLIYGRRFFREELGTDSKVLWLVDTFGFPHTLPQIARGCGIEFFVTTKISWNRYNRFPYTFFNWQSPDGTKLPTYFMTVPWEAIPESPNASIDTYNAVPDPVTITLGWQRRFPKEQHRELFNSIGWGDGGGGATYEMIEWMRAIDKIGGKLDAKWQKSYDFLSRQMAKCSFELPVWNDELFLEFHRGTLTTHAELKKYNRLSEITLQQAEFVNAVMDIENYSSGNFRQIWQRMLINQFHDVMAGSSSHDVFEEARQIYLDVIDDAKKQIECVGTNFFGQGENITILNTLAHNRDAIVELELPEGKTIIYKKSESNDTINLPFQRTDKNHALVAVSLPPAGYQKLKIVQVDNQSNDSAKTREPVKVSKDTIENKFLKVTFDDKTGNIISIIDKSDNREILTGIGNELQLFEDKPFNQSLSGWEIDRIFKEKPLDMNIKLVSLKSFGGDIRAGFVIEKKFSNSYIVQHIYLDYNSPVLKFETEIDWHEHEVLLKAAFPVAINSSHACYDIQFGHIYRPTHRNTLLDIAKFEVPVQRWMDISEGDYGVSLLNDCKYGADVENNVLRLTLLRAPVNPDPLADRGKHSFTYALYPHLGNFAQAHTVRYANELNVAPLVFRAGEGQPDSVSFFELDSDNLIIETVKKAEDEEALVLRIYESANKRGSAILKFNLPYEIKHAALCNMEEKDIEKIELKDNRLQFDYLPCQIITIKLYM